MNYQFIQVLIIGLLLVFSIVGSTVYCIVYDSNNNEKIENQEDKERNNAEIVWFWISLMSCIVILFILGILCIVDKKVKSLEMFKTVRNYNLIVLVLALFNIVTTSVSWDYFSRKNTNQVQRESFMIITFIGAMMFLKVLDNVFISKPKQSVPATP